MSLDFNCDTRMLFTGDGNLTDFTVAFDFYEESDVKVAFYSPYSESYTIVEPDDLDYGYTVDAASNGTLIRFKTAPELNQQFMIYRLTPVDPMRVDFEPGKPIKAQDLDDNFNQLASAIEDTRCLVEATIDGDLDGDLYWKKAGETIYSNNTWSSSDCYIATAKAIDQRFESLVTVSDEPPASPNYQGQLWWNSSVADLFIYYDDSNSDQWVSASVALSDAPSDGLMYGRQDQMWKPINGEDGNPIFSDVANTPANIVYARKSGASNQWVDLDTERPIGAGTITIKQDGEVDQQFNVNQTGDTTITLKNDNTQNPNQNLQSVTTIGNNTNNNITLGPTTPTAENPTKITLDATDGNATFAGVVEAVDLQFGSAHAIKNVVLDSGDPAGAVVSIYSDITSGTDTYGFRYLPETITSTNSSATNQIAIGFESTLGVLTSAVNCKDILSFNVEDFGSSINAPNLKKHIGYRSGIEIGPPTGTVHSDYQAYNFYAAGSAPNFFASNTYIGGIASRNTRELWESTLTEEQKEQLAAGTLTVPANVSTPGDGSFVRQWWYGQQSAEDQALIDSGELEYPERYQPENFVDTFALGTDTNIDLLANGLGKFAYGVKVTGGDAATIGDGLLKFNNEIRLVTNGQTAFAANQRPVFAIGKSIDANVGLDIECSPNSFTNANSKQESRGVQLQVNAVSTAQNISGFTVLSDYTGTNVESSIAFDANPVFDTGDDHDLAVGFGNLLAGSTTVSFAPQRNILFYGNYNTHNNQATTNQNYNFYAAGNAPNYFRGLTTFSPAPKTPAELQYADGTDSLATGLYLDASGAISTTRYGTTDAANIVFNRTLDPATADSNRATFIAFAKNGNVVGNITATEDGGILIQSESATGPVITQNSDARVKTLTPFTGNATDVVSQLNPGVNGFIAHELQAQVSDAVTGTRNATEAIGTLTDAEGVVTTDVTEPEAIAYGATWVQTGTRPVYQGVDQTKLIPLLTKALQEALERIEQLEADHATLMNGGNNNGY